MPDTPHNKELAAMAYYQQPLDVTTLPAWQVLLKHRQDLSLIHI